jgi:hypothetical protein
MLQFDNRRDGFAAHIFDGVLIAQPVRALDGVVHVPAPVVLAHVAERGGNAALRGNGVRAGRENLGDAGGLQALFAMPKVARRPAPPAPTTTFRIEKIDATAIANSASFMPMIFASFMHSQ